MLRYRQGYRICDLCERAYPPNTRECNDPSHRSSRMRGDTEISPTQLTRPIESDERRDMALKALGAELAGSISANAKDEESADAIMDAVLSVVGGIEDAKEEGRQEILKDPEVFGLTRLSEPS